VRVSKLPDIALILREASPLERLAPQGEGVKIPPPEERPKGASRRMRRSDSIA
jgi:hypothetical protein